MAKKKAEWIKDIHTLNEANKEHDLLGEITKEELESMTVSQLKKLHADMEADLQADNAEEAAEPENKENGKFASMCGDVFNPKKSGTCFKECQNDFPEAFAACKDNYETSEVGKKKSRSSKPTLGKTEWGHTKTKQGGLIDEWFLENKEPVTMAELCEFCGGREPRVMHHMKHLVADLGIVLLYNTREVETEQDDGSVKKSKVKQYWWQEKDKRRKGDVLEGKSAYPKK